MKNQPAQYRIDARRHARSTLALVLSLVLGAGALPAAPMERTPDPGSREARFYRIGDYLFRMEHGGDAKAGAVLLEREGEFRVVLSRGVDPFSPAEREWRRHGFTFEEEPGSEPIRADHRAGRHQPPARWEEVVIWTVSTTEETVSSTFRVGADWISLTLPRELLATGGTELPAEASIVVEANGIATRLDRALFERLRQTGTCDDAATGGREARALREMADSFVDLPRFLNHVRGYLEIERRARLRQAQDRFLGDQDPTPSSCTTLCLSCAGSLLASVGTYIALVAACGGTLVTGGTTAVLCVAAFIGVQSSHLVVFASCARCVECAGEPDCPCAGQPLCDCG